MCRRSGDGAKPAPRGTRREAGKSQRVEALLDAAGHLIEGGAGTDFTMQQLAERAGFSLATAYNLIGTKAAVLYALLGRSLDELADLQRAASPVPDPDRRLAGMVALAVEFFIGNADYYRPLMLYLLGVHEPEKRPLFMARALAFWREATAGEADDLSIGLHLAFTGALDLWVHRELTSEEFRTLMLHQASLLSVAVNSMGASQDFAAGSTS